MPKPNLTDKQLEQLKDSWCRNMEETQKMARNTTTQVISMYKSIFQRWSNAYGDNNKEFLEQQVLTRYAGPLLSFCEGIIKNVHDWNAVVKLCDECGRRHAKYVPFHRLTPTEFASVGMVLASSIREIISERDEKGINAAKLGDMWLVLLQAVVEQLSGSYEEEFEKTKEAENATGLHKRRSTKQIGRHQSSKELSKSTSVQSIKNKGASWCSVL